MIDEPIFKEIVDDYIKLSRGLLNILNEHLSEKPTLYYMMRLRQYLDDNLPSISKYDITTESINNDADNQKILTSYMVYIVELQRFLSDSKQTNINIPCMEHYIKNTLIPFIGTNSMFITSYEDLFRPIC